VKCETHLLYVYVVKFGVGDIAHKWSSINCS